MQAVARQSRFSAALVALAALCWGVSGGIGGVLIEDGVGTLVVAFYRGAIGLLCFSVWLSVCHGGSGIGSGRLWLWSIVAGLGVAGNFAFYFFSMSEGSIAIAATLMYCAPVYVYLVSFALRLERSTVSKWFAIAGVMTGIVLLTGVYDVAVEGVTPAGILSGLLAGLCYAVFIFAFKNAAPHGEPQAILFVAFLALSIVLLGLAGVDSIIRVRDAANGWMYAALGLLGAGGSFYLYVVGIRGTAPTVASVLAMIEPITASLFGVAFMGQHLGIIQVAGVVLILAAVAWLSSGGRD